MAAYQISPACTSCQDCVDVCPTFSIYFGVGQFVIDIDTCSGCGVCSTICPVDVIAPLVVEDLGDIDKLLADAGGDSKK